MEAKRIFCVGKVHDGFLAVRFGEHKSEAQLPDFTEEELRHIEEELIDYIEAQQDESFWREGGW